MAGNFRDLLIFQKAFVLAMDIFEITKKFPADEKFELTDQIRRSSRAVCRAIGEGYRKRQYAKYFVNKMSDADMENNETQISLEFAIKCNYLSNEPYNNLLSSSEEIGRMLNHMIEYPEKYAPKAKI